MVIIIGVALFGCGNPTKSVQPKATAYRPSNHIIEETLYPPRTLPSNHLFDSLRNVALVARFRLAGSENDPLQPSYYTDTTGQPRIWEEPFQEGMGTPWLGFLVCVLPSDVRKDFLNIALNIMVGTISHIQPGQVGESILAAIGEGPNTFSYKLSCYALAVP